MYIARMQGGVHTLKGIMSFAHVQSGMVPFLSSAEVRGRERVRDRDTERERERETQRERECVCLRERERERERKMKIKALVHGEVLLLFSCQKLFSR